jgi:hypothetical protein
VGPQNQTEETTPKRKRILMWKARVTAWFLLQIVWQDEPSSSCYLYQKGGRSTRDNYDDGYGVLTALRVVPEVIGRKLYGSVELLPSWGLGEKGKPSATVPFQRWVGTVPVVPSQVC